MTRRRRRLDPAADIIMGMAGAAPPPPQYRIEGIRAIADGVCARCPDPILTDERIVPAPGVRDGWIHVRCAPGQDDE